MKFKVIYGLALALLLILVATASQAQVNCNAQIIDQTGMVHNPQVITSASRTLINQGADVHVVIVDSIQRYGSSLADVERSYEQSCPSWTTNGQRKANLFIVMVAPNDRAKNMFLGSYYAGAFDITSTYSALSNSYFKNRQWELGIAAVINGTTGQALSYHQRTFQAQQRVVPPTRAYTTPNPTYRTNSDAGSGHVGLWIFGFIVLGLVGLTLYLLFRRGNGVDTYATGSDNVSSTTSHTTPSTASGSFRTRSYAAAAPSYAPPPYVPHTTVINNNTDSGNGLLTGLLVGEALSRNNNLTPVYVQPTPVYSDPTPSYVPDPTPVQDAPDSSWEEPAAAQPDTGFDPSPSYDSPSSDSSFGDSSSSSDSSFGDSSSSSDSSFGDSSSSGDSGF